MKLALLLLLVVYAWTPVVARSQAKRPGPGETTEQQLIELTCKWDEALLKRDVDALDLILADDYAFADTPKSYYLAALKTPDIQYASYKRSDIAIRVYGDTALVHATTDVGGKFPGVDWFWSLFHSLDVWIKQNGQWKCVATMHDEIKGETSRGRVQVGPQVKADLVIVFKSGTTEEQLNGFLRAVLQRPNPYGEGYKNQPGVRSILRVPPIDGYQAVAVSFHEDAKQVETDQIKSRVRSASLVDRVFKDIAPKDIKLK